MNNHLMNGSQTNQESDWFCGLVDNCGSFEIDEENKTVVFRLIFEKNIKQQKRQHPSLDFTGLVSHVEDLLSKSTKSQKFSYELKHINRYLCFNVNDPNLIKNTIFPLLYNYKDREIHSDVPYKLVTSKFWSAYKMETFLDDLLGIQSSPLKTSRLKNLEKIKNTLPEINSLPGAFWWSPFMVQVLQNASQTTREALVEGYWGFLNQEFLEDLFMKDVINQLPLPETERGAFGKKCKQDFYRLSRLLQQEIVQQTPDAYSTPEHSQDPEKLVSEILQKVELETDKVIDKNRCSLKTGASGQKTLAFLLSCYKDKKFFWDLLMAGKEKNESFSSPRQNLHVWLHGFLEHGLQLKIKTRFQNKTTSIYSRSYALRIQALTCSDLLVVALLLELCHVDNGKRNNKKNEREVICPKIDWYYGNKWSGEKNTKCRVHVADTGSCAKLAENILEKVTFVGPVDVVLKHSRWKNGSLWPVGKKRSNDHLDYQKKAFNELKNIKNTNTPKKIEFSITGADPFRFLAFPKNVLESQKKSF